MRPAWWLSGKKIRSNQFGHDAYDIGEFLEGEEFEYEWRICKIPMCVLKTFDFEKFTKCNNSNRCENIRAWYDAVGVYKALSKTPPVALAYRGKVIKILDGWHRIA